MPGSSASSSSAGSDAGGDWGEWTDDEGQGLKSLFDDSRFEGLEEVLAHDEAAHGFNLRQYRAQLGLDQVGTIRLINYIRAAVAGGGDPRAALQAAAAAPAESAPWAADEAYLRPVLADDELMFHDWEGEGEEAGGAAGAAAGAAAGGEAGGAGAGGPELQRLAAENEQLRGMLEALRAVVLADDSVRELVDEAAAGAAAAAAAGAGPSTSQQPAAPAPAVAVTTAPANEEAARIDGSYFDSYSTFDIHRDMLADKVRTEAYRDALERNPRLVQGARVLDVGCGTGILSMFAARGGAASLVAIDGSEQIAKFARANVEANGLAGTITVVSSRVEALGALPPPPPPAAGGAEGSGHRGGDAEPEGGQQVDVLVSEWMGYALLFESMLDSVLHARDRWLRPGGAVLPDVAQLYVAAGGEGATGLDFWRDVYGFGMPAVRDSLAGDALKRAVVRAVAPQHLLSEPAAVQRFDLATMTADDQDFTAPFRLTVGAGPRECHALVLWFDCLFSDRFCGEHPVELSTSPMGPQTHWVQTVLLLKAPVVMAPAAVAPPGAAVALEGQLSMARSRTTHRSLDIVLRYAPRYADGSAGEEQTVLYGMGVES